jgi:hypothetical protein
MMKIDPDNMQEHMRQKWKEYVVKNPEKRRAQRRRYYEKHYEVLLQKSQTYKKNNLDKYKEYATKSAMKNLTKTKCKCGCLVRPDYLKKHMKTNKHLDLMNATGKI